MDLIFPRRVELGAGAGEGGDARWWVCAGGQQGMTNARQWWRRAAAAVAPAPAPQEYACGGYARQQPPQPQWGCYGAAAAKSASFGMYGGDVVDAAADGPCLSWMLNVMPSSPAFAVRERPTLFQYY